MSETQAPTKTTKATEPTPIKTAGKKISDGWKRAKKAVAGVGTGRGARPSTDPWSPNYKPNYSGGYSDYDYGDYDDLWDARGSGASGVTHYLGTSNYYNYTGYSDGTFEYTDTLRFARNLADIVAKKNITGVSWRPFGHGMSRSDKASRGAPKQVWLEPRPVKQSIGKREMLDTVKTIVGGNALHEASHIMHTPLYLEKDILEMCERQDRSNYHEAVAKAAMTLIEDNYVEKKVLDSFPGYRPYLDEHWRFNMPEAKVTEALTLLQAPDTALTPTLLFDVIQDLQRRHTPVPDGNKDIMELLHEDKLKYIEGAARIIDRVTINSTESHRSVLTTQLYELLLKGKIAPEDQADLGEQAFQPSIEQQQKLNNELERLLRSTGRIDGEGRGSDEAKLKEGMDDQQAQRVQGAIDRDMQQEEVEIVTNVGNEMVKVTFIDSLPCPSETHAAQAMMKNHVPKLMQKLKFRANAPMKHITAQLRGRMDDSRMIEFPLSMQSGRPPRAFSRAEIISAPKIGIELLVDESGSMSASQRTKEFGHTQRFIMARYAATLLDEALRRLRSQTNGGVDYMIHGHTTPMGDMGLNASREDRCVVFRIVDPQRPGPERLGSITAYGGNYDGPALAAVARLAEKKWYDRERLILFINDGLPNGDSYGGAPAHDAIRDHCNWLRSRGTQVLMIYLGTGAPHKELAHMYGPLNQGYIVCEQIGELPNMVGKVLTKVLKWQA